MAALQILRWKRRRCEKHYLAEWKEVKVQDLHNACIFQHSVDVELCFEAGKGPIRV